MRDAWPREETQYDAHTRHRTVEMARIKITARKPKAKAASTSGAARGDASGGGGEHPRQQVPASRNKRKRGRRVSSARTSGEVETGAAARGEGGAADEDEVEEGLKSRASVKRYLVTVLGLRLLYERRFVSS